MDRQHVQAIPALCCHGAELLQQHDESACLRRDTTVCGFCRPCIVVLQEPLILHYCPSKRKALYRDVACGLGQQCDLTRCALPLHPKAPLHQAPHACADLRLQALRILLLTALAVLSSLPGACDAGKSCGGANPAEDTHIASL